MSYRFAATIKHISKMFKLITLGLVLLLTTGLRAQSLIHYWNFNNSTSEQTLLAPSFSAVGSPSIQHVQGGNSAIQITSNTGQGFDITNPNTRNGDAALTHLRLNEPIGSELIIQLPSTGYKDLLFTYATRRSGQGAGTQFIAYSTNGTTFIPFDTISPVDGNPAAASIDFSSLTAANDNANFMVRITFSATGGGTGGNNRFDNMTLDGNPLSGDVTPPSVTFIPANSANNIAINVQPIIRFSEDVRLINNTSLNDQNVDNIVELRLNDAAGSQISFDASVSGRDIIIIPNAPLTNSQKYWFALKANTIEDLSDNAITSVQSSEFTTISVQTSFQPGDIVPVAYRMNATGTDDQFAILTLVNILPGTQINFTDAKYTDNSPAQCPGGFTWQAPTSGVASGTVITFTNDASPVQVSLGSIMSGSSFGLSSGGDQVLVYTGSHDNPNYITALSANAWVSTQTACGGSNSKLPTGLQDGVSSLNLSTAPDAVNGLLVNAYYNGPQSGSPAQLKAAVLNPANWIGVGAGTPPQTWPVWNFPGPPSVISASVLNANSIRIIFNTDLNAASASNAANYTGINNISNVAVTNNGTLADTVTLTFSNSFTNNTTYNLSIQGVQNTSNQAMFAPFIFNFTYNTTISWQTDFGVIKEANGAVFQLPLSVNFPSNASVKIVAKAAPWSTAVAADYTLSQNTITLDGNTPATLQIPINIVNDNLNEQTEYLVLSLEDENGVAISGSRLFTLYIQDDERKAPIASKAIRLQHIGSFDPSGSSNATTEIVAYDSASRRLFTISSIQGRLDIIDFSNPAQLTTIKTVNLNTYGAVNSVAVYKGIVALAIENSNAQLDGKVVFMDIEGQFISEVTVGAMPDMITFSPDGKWVMTANEGEPNNAYTIDPEGSVSIIDISNGVTNLNQSAVSTLLFTNFNSQEASLVASGIRKLKSTSTLSQDLEPEYIAISADSRKAWVAIQENNAIAEIDIINKSITSLWPLGTKDYSAAGNGFDASDRSGNVLISNWNVKAFFIPDAIANFTVNGKNYIITANEGDEKEYGGLNERTTVGAVNLDPTVYPNAEMLKQDHALGRLRITNLNGVENGIYKQIHVVGARSFSIFDTDTKSLVYDSGDDLEQITAADPISGPLFNSDHEGNSFKSRSRSKGPEPEGVCVAPLAGKIYAFVSLERVGGVAVYDITDPAKPIFTDYLNTRSATAYAGDHGPEGITFVSESQSPDGKPYILVANEISGTLTIFRLDVPSAPIVSFNQNNRIVSEDVGTFTIGLNLDKPAIESGSVTIGIQNGNGLNSNDYSILANVSNNRFTLPINKGFTQLGFQINIVDDTEFEGNETLTLNLIETNGFFTIGSPSTVQITIEDNDPNSIDPANLNQIRYWPNPMSEGKAILNFSQEISGSILNAQGAQVAEIVQSKQANLQSLSAGIYHFKGVNGESFKIVIVK